MPASQTVSWFDGLEAEVRADDGSKSIYYSDEKPTFILELSNNSEYNFAEDSQLGWFLGVGSGRPDPHVDGTIEVGELSRGETREYEFGNELLGMGDTELLVSVVEEPEETVVLMKEFSRHHIQFFTNHH